MESGGTLAPRPRLALVDHVRRWRVDQLYEAGYPQPAAEELADRPDIDLHVAVDLLRHGCTPETALRILL